MMRHVQTPPNCLENRRYYLGNFKLDERKNRYQVGHVTSTNSYSGQLMVPRGFATATSWTSIRMPKHQLGDVLPGRWLRGSVT